MLLFVDDCWTEIVEGESLLGQLQVGAVASKLSHVGDSSFASSAWL